MNTTNSLNNEEIVDTNYLFCDNPDLKDYIEYYFYNMIGLSKERNVYYKKNELYNLSIMKDETKRVLDGSGKLREKPWSNFLFFQIDIPKYKSLFGTNKKHRDLIGDNYLTDWISNEASKNPDQIHFSRKNNYIIAKNLFELYKKKHPELFIRSYVYISLILVDNKEISTNNFLTYYFNTNYKFAETNGKKKFISNVSYSYLVEDLDFELDLLSSNNRDLIDCAKAYNGELDFADQTKYNFDNISDSIENGDEYILVEGTARTGKTIIAMSLLHKFPNAHLLLMNYYFYCSLKEAFISLNYSFPTNRIFHQAYGKNGYYDDSQEINYDFLVIDECQRLGKKYGVLDKIVTNYNHKHTVFLGDDYQRLMSSSDDGISYIIEKVVNDSLKQIKKFKLTNSIGIPPQIIKNVKFLLGAPEVKNPFPMGEYNIEIFDDETSFITSYENDEYKKKHLCTIQEPSYNFSSIGKYSAYPRRFINSAFPYFLNNEIISNYYLSPFELISREVESIYIFVRKNVTPDNIVGFVFTQLYVLMTRATISLNLYFENEDTKDLINERLIKIKQYSLNNDKSIESYIEEGQFYIPEDFVDYFSREYNIETPKDRIFDRHITRLVHFTEESNIEKILKDGILPRKYLQDNNAEFDYNDCSRLDGFSNATCLSIENPNLRLLKAFKEKYPHKKYKLIVINPSILFSSFEKNDDIIRLVKRYYCNYNAAACMTKKSNDDIDIMFESKVQTYYYVFTRNGQEDNIPTASQAEILFFGKIPPEYIEFVEDI